MVFKHNKISFNSPFYLLEHYLINGNVDERVLAICFIKHSPKQYNLFWEIFLSDESNTVAMNAFSAAISSNPEKIPEISMYLWNERHKQNCSNEKRIRKAQEQLGDIIGGEFKRKTIKLKINNNIK